MKLSLVFGPDKKGYIENPYWPEMFRLIEIQKQSGVNRARTEANRRRALEEHLRSISMTFEQYQQLERDANRPFHTNGDGSVVILSDKILACLVNANDVGPSKIRINNLRVALRPTDFKTPKKQPDGIWERFAVVTSGTGGKLSNQRGLRRSSFIRDFTATGQIDHDPEMVKPEAVLALLRYAGLYVGVGASRKMGWGRFEVKES